VRNMGWPGEVALLLTLFLLVEDEESFPDSGVLTSPNWPKAYPGSHDSTQTIQVAEGETIDLVWTAFNIELSGNDYVQVVDGDGTDITPKLWGHAHPPPTYSNTNIVHVKFHTNGDTHWTGWRLDWHVYKEKHDLSLSSSGGAGEWQGNSLGVFQYVRDGDEGHVYQQRHDGDGVGHFMFRLGQFWYVGPTLGTESGAYLRAPVQEEIDSIWIDVSGTKTPPPERGWQYHAGNNTRYAEQYEERAWTIDSSTKLWGLSHLACPILSVGITGEAAEQWQSGGSQAGSGNWAGKYIAAANKWNRGRKVFQHESGTDKYLFVPSYQSSSWLIGSTIDDVGQAWISSGSAGTDCPGSPEIPKSRRLGRKSWAYWKGDKWHESLRVFVVRISI